MAITRETIKQQLEGKNLSVNVRLAGDQTHFVVTLKTAFQIPVEAISESVVISRAKSHIRRVLMSDITGWYNFYNNG